MNTRLFVDMDGTLAKFTPVDEIEELYEKGYFLNLEPQRSVIDAVRELVKQPNIEVFILSAVLDSPYASKEKNLWLDKYLPEIDASHRILAEYGHSKGDYIKDGVRPTDVLLDDYTINLNEWCPPGQAIKLMNNINGTKGTWKGNKVYYIDFPKKIASDILCLISKTQKKDVFLNLDVGEVELE